MVLTTTADLDFLGPVGRFIGFLGGDAADTWLATATPDGVSTYSTILCCT